MESDERYRNSTETCRWPRIENEHSADKYDNNSHREHRGTDNARRR